MLNVGLVGLGFMGMIHSLNYARVRGSRVVAMCEKDQKRLAGDWRDIQGNFGPRGELMDLSGIDRYTELDEMLASEKIDMVDICLPPAFHADAAVAALQAGKHVFCEKPMSLSAKDAKRMMAAREKSGKLLMIGHVLPFFPEYEFAYKAIAGGKYGKLLGGHFKRIISDPTWLKDFYNPTRVGGPMLDLHIHDAHFVRLAFGMPKAVASVGRMRGEVAELFNTQFHYDDDRMVTAASGVINQQGRAFSHGFEMYFEQATLIYDFSVIGGEPTLSMPLTVLDARGKATQPKLGSGDPVDAFESEIAEVARSISHNRESKILGARLAYDALVLCQKQEQSLKTRRVVKIA
jgi:predicted dehydrogenase